MLTFLRINSFFQLVSLLVILLLVKIPFLGGKLPILLPELEWMLIGERLNDGYKLYEEIWTNVGPLSGFVYWLVDTSFGRSQFAYEFVAMFFIYIQAAYLTLSTNNRQVFLEKNFVIGAVYILLTSISFDCGKLSPSLMATTFVIFALNGLMKQIENRDGVGDDIFEVGFYVSIATLFYLPTFVYLFWIILACILFTGASFRQIILVILGYILPIFIAAIYYYFFGEYELFKFNLLHGSLRIDQYSLQTIFEIFYTSIVPLVTAFFGFLFLVRTNRYSGYQGRIHQIALLGVIFGIVAYFLAPYKTPMQLASMFPFLAILVTGLFLHIKGTAKPEIAFISFVVVVLIIQYQGVTPLFGDGYQHLSKIRTQNVPANYEFSGKKLLITGTQIDEYKVAKQATCYLDWNLSKTDLAKPDNYESVVTIFHNFKRDSPDVIIDKENVMPTIFKRIPELSKSYSKGKSKNIWLKK